MSESPVRNAKVPSPTIQGENIIQIETPSIEDVIEFVFPSSQSHPKSGARLYALADHIHRLGKDKVTGTVHLLGGNHKFIRPLNSFEMKHVLAEVEKNFYHDVYPHRLNIRTEQNSHELKTYGHKAVEDALRYTIEEVMYMLNNKSIKKAPKESENNYKQRLIMQDRAERIKELQKSTPDLTKFRLSKEKDWNKTCCVKNTGKGTYVSSNNTIRATLHGID